MGQPAGVRRFCSVGETSLGVGVAWGISMKNLDIWNRDRASAIGLDVP